jgi:ribosomal protein S18 acetylase RimI-like enzyme
MTNGAEPAGAKAEICRWADMQITPELTAQLDAIFYQTAGRTFANSDDRAAFRQLWLGQYIEHDPDKAYLAIDRSNTGETRVLGYLVGSWDDPLTSPQFAKLTFFRDFATQCHAFPAQLHLNLDANARSRGIGRLLVDAFAAQAQAAGVPGVHVVTGKTARNVGFYERAGFRLQATTLWNGNEIVFLGRTLT